MKLKKLFLTLMAMISFPCDADVSPRERAALIAIYDSLGGSNWTNNTNWLSGDPCSNNWFGITCQDNQITKIVFNNKSLAGQIPSQIGDFSELEALVLGGSEAITGNIPSEIGKLTNLKTLYLANNQLSGSIPIDIGNLTKLSVLRLEQNMLSGPIPSEIGHMTSLYEFYASGNQLSGEIPPGIGNLSQLTLLYLRGNQLTGSIPETFRNLTRMFSFSLANNKLSGPIPLALTEMHWVFQVYLGNNQLTGRIPPEIANMNRLKYIELNDNLLEGNIPVGLKDLEILEKINLSNNQLSGQLPAALAESESLKFLTLANNNFFGTLPQGYGKFFSLNLNNNNIIGQIPSSWSEKAPSRLHLDNNKLIGPIPDGFSYFQELSLANNFITGNIPSQLGSRGEFFILDLSNNNLSGSIPNSITTESYTAEYISISGNQLSGEIPHNFGSLRRLQHLDLSDNFLTGPIPKDLTGLSKLKFLSLKNNLLSGSIPSTLGDFELLETLEINNNRLSGGLPKEFGNLNHLRMLSLGNNQLFGYIPDEFGMLNMLEYLYLANNQLSGALPESLGQLSQIKAIDLSSNLLNGSIPNTIAQLEQLSSFDVSWNALHSTDSATIELLNHSLDDDFVGNWMSTQTPVPTDFHMVNQTETYFTVAWNEPYGFAVDGYQIWMAVSDSGPYTMVFESNDSSQTSHSIEKHSNHNEIHVQLKHVSNPHTDNSNWVYSDAIDLSGNTNANLVYPNQSQHSGSWFNPDQPGHGFSLQLLSDDSAWIYWYVFDDQGNQIWLVGEGHFFGNTISAQMKILSGGGFPPEFEAENVASDFWGTLRIEFTGDNNSQVSWKTAQDSEYQDGKLSLQQLTRIDSDQLMDQPVTAIKPGHSGSWYNPNQSGHGISVEIIPNNRGQIYWYVFDNQGNQIWLTGSGEHDGKNLSVPMAIVTDGLFPPNFENSPINIQHWGLLNLTFNNCQSATMSWHPNDSDNYTAGEMDLQHLTLPMGLTCSDE